MSSTSIPCPSPPASPCSRRASSSSLPNPATSAPPFSSLAFLILRSALYQFQGIGDDDEDVTYSLQGDAAVYFRPRSLRNLVPIDELQNALPVTDMLVENLFNEETPQIVTACGTGPRSSLRILRQGISVSERAVSPLPGVPAAVWSIKGRQADAFDKYIIVSFKDATMVLSIGETVEEVLDSGFLPVRSLPSSSSLN